MSNNILSLMCTKCGYKHIHLDTIKNSMPFNKYTGFKCKACSKILKLSEILITDETNIIIRRKRAIKEII